MHPSLHFALALAMGAALACAAKPAAAAAEPDAGKGEPGTVHINAIKNPERYTYRAVVAGLDKFDEKHALAPNVPEMRFHAEVRRGKAADGPPLAARIAADEFSIPLVLDKDGRFSVPRSQAAWDAKAELLMNRKKREGKFNTYVRTPGLPDNQYRLGDVRLDCQVKIAIAKEEIPFWANALINGILLTTDWCSWFKGETPKGGNRVWGQDANAVLSAATLRDGERSMKLEIEDKQFRVPLADASWSNDAIIELEFAPPAAPAQAEPAAAAAP